MVIRVSFAEYRVDWTVHGRVILVNRTVTLVQACDEVYREARRQVMGHGSHISHSQKHAVCKLPVNREIEVVGYRIPRTGVQYSATTGKDGQVSTGRSKRHVGRWSPEWEGVGQSAARSCTEKAA